MTAIVLGALARLRASRAQALLGVSTVTLAAFYYGMRADVIGVHAAGGSWAAMTTHAWPAAVHYVGSLVLLALVPLAVAIGFCGIRPSELGLGLGRWREGLAWLAVGIPLAILAGSTAADSEAMRAVYPIDRALATDPGRMAPNALLQMLYYGSWEVLFRGVLLFGLRGAIGGGNANVVQTALSVVAHFGRAPDETFAAIPAGLLFGWIGLRVRSIWYVAVLHWLVGASMEWFIATQGRGLSG